MLNRSVYRCVVVGLLLTMMGVLTGVFAPGQSDTDLGVVSTQVHLPVIVTTAALYALLLWNVVSLPRRYFQALFNQWSLLPLLSFCLLSVSWSSDASLTLRRTLILSVTVLIALVIGTDFELPEIGRMLAAASLLHLALCVVFFVVGRHYLFAPEDPSALKGLTTHKNVFGFEQGMAVLALWFCPFRRWPYSRWICVPLAGGALIWSHSSGALIATIAALGIAPVLQLARLSPKQRWPVATVAAIGVMTSFVAIIMNLERIPALFSKDATLTGRTELWSLVLIAIRSHVWAGFGFDSFWRGLEGDSLTVIRSVGWLVPTAHNGYLDLLLSIGAIGAALLALVFVVYLQRSFSYMTNHRGSERFFPFVFVILVLVYNLNESALLTRSGQPFFLFVALMTAMAPSNSSARIRQGADMQSSYVSAGPSY